MYVKAYSGYAIFKTTYYLQPAVFGRLPKYKNNMDHFIL